jgi:hypothetical protein
MPDKGNDQIEGSPKEENISPLFYPNQEEKWALTNWRILTYCYHVEIFFIDIRIIECPYYSPQIDHLPIRSRIAMSYGLPILPLAYKLELVYTDE